MSFYGQEHHVLLPALIVQLPVIYNGNEVFNCNFPECMKSFKSRSSLNRHVDADHATTPIRKKCPHCPDASYKYACDLMKHIREVHGLIETERGGFYSENCKRGLYDVCPL
uniref:C2H2-type domain-containing protein n=1 Tax=Steinernema glaseri TaxID=37863 RepID=A0A1I8AX09_9BILA